MAFFNLFIISFIILFSAITQSADFNLANSDSRQLVVVITDNALADSGTMYTFEKEKTWQATALTSNVMIGKNGLAWGLGLHSLPSAEQKKEGDGKAPAGVFKLGTAFGYLEQLPTKLSYQQMTADDYCIDVNGSAYYNQLVNRNQVGEFAVKDSTEPMRRDIHLNNDQVYKKGIWVHHNDSNISGAGSCIFVHLWRKNGAPTAGCTAMPEEALDKLLLWLDKSKQPLLISLTKADYLTLQAKWQLPVISIE